VGFDRTEILYLVLRLPVVLFALTMHEFMHAWVAWKCGDDTALRAGRVTFNPLAHLDLIGTICLIFAPIGWAKPVPVNPYNYGNPRRDEILVSGAGVAANLVMAVVAAMVVRLLILMDALPATRTDLYLWAVLSHMVMVNLGLFIFNLVPISPLDGSHILREILRGRWAIGLGGISRYGPFILLALVFANRATSFSMMGYRNVSLLGAPVLLLAHLFAGADGTNTIISILHLISTLGTGT